VVEGVVVKVLSPSARVNGEDPKRRVDNKGLASAVVG
jgi:DUF971 family protein